MDSVYVCSKLPLVFPLAQAGLLTASEGLLLSMAIDGQGVMFQNAIESITDTLEKGRGAGPDHVVKHHHIVLRGKWAAPRCPLMENRTPRMTGRDVGNGREVTDPPYGRLA